MKILKEIKNDIVNELWLLSNHELYILHALVELGNQCSIFQLLEFLYKRDVILERNALREILKSLLNNKLDNFSNELGNLSEEESGVSYSYPWLQGYIHDIDICVSVSPIITESLGSVIKKIGNSKQRTPIISRRKIEN